MESPTGRPSAPRGPAAEGEARRLVGGVLVVSVLASVALVVLAIDRTDSVLEPGVGTRGVDPTNVGPRVFWSRAEVPTRAAANATQSPERGKELYAQWCAACHGDKGAGDGILAKALSPPPRDFTKGRFRFRTTAEGTSPSDEDLHRTISVGILASRMPSFAFLSATDRWALVDEVKRLSAFYDEDEGKSLNYFELIPPGPVVSFADARIAPTPEAIERGRRVFLEKGECWKCHGKEGRGDGPSSATLVAEEGSKLPAPNLRRGPAGLKSVADANDVLRVLNLGISGTPMPSYAKTLSAEELRDLALFTESLWAITPRGRVTDLTRGSTALTAEESRARLGETTFLMNCAGCHGKIGRGDGPAAAGFSVRPANVAEGPFKLKSTPEGSLPTRADLARTLRGGIRGTSMPAWNLHSEAELDAVVSYLFDLRGDVGPAAPVSLAMPAARLGTPESIEQGKQLFAKSCATCHGAGGAGDGAFAPILTDYRGERLRPRDFTREPMKLGEAPEDLFRAVSLGFEGTPMPGFAAALGDLERCDLVSFLLTLRPARFQTQRNLR